MSNDLISVIMPAYNAEKYISEAIESILSQTYTNLELIIINDGSKDSTGSIIDKYQKQHENIKVIHQDNRGQCAACNEGYKHANGSYIKFFDADDILSPNFIKLQHQQLQGSSTKIASAEWGRFYDSIEKTLFIPEKVWQTLKPIDWLVMSMEEAENMMQCALWLIPKQILDKSGLWDERLSLINDFEFFVRVLLQAEEIVFTPNAKLYYRSGISNSLSGMINRKGLESAFLSIKLGLNHLLCYENSPRTKQVAANIWQCWLYQFYPSQKDLTSLAEKELKQLKITPTYKIDKRITTNLVLTIVGWRGLVQARLFYKNLKQILN